MALNNRRRITSKTVSVDQSSLRIQDLTQAHFDTERLPGATFPSPMIGVTSDVDRYIMYDPQVRCIDQATGLAVSNSQFRIRVAQAAKTNHFNPADTVIGIVTCGGLCPGLNDVVRGITYMALRSYGVKRVVGFRNGFWGLSAKGRDSVLELDTSVVQSIHRRGGTALGSSRGPQSPVEMVDTLVQLGVRILFTIGGDGTQRGASTIAKEAARRGLDISVIGVPKTIDNDLSFSHRTFGFETAVEHAVVALRAAHAEASSAPFGIGVVKVMGRHSGFIAATAAVASQQVNICLIPEMPVSKETVIALIKSRFLAGFDYAVICVAEGFGQDWCDGSNLGTDASGNKKLTDIGVVLRNEIAQWLKKSPYSEGTVKLIDPSYMIRAVPPTVSDAGFCVNLATLAVHEAMRGTTNALISNWYNNYIVVPIALATSLRKVVSLEGDLWRQVREVTTHVTKDDGKSMKRKFLSRRVEILENELAQAKATLSKL